MRVCVCVIDCFGSFQLVCCFFLFTPAVSRIRLYTVRDAGTRLITFYISFSSVSLLFSPLDDLLISYYFPSIHTQMDRLVVNSR